MNIQKVKAAIFDLDGTLLDTIADIGTGANLALCRFGLPRHDLSAYPQFVGHGIANMVRQIVPEGTPEAVRQQVLDCFLQYYPEHCTDLTTPYEGVYEFLKALTERGIQPAVISNKAEAITRKIVHHFFPEIPWAFVWGGSPERPLKPNPAAGKLACEALGLEPEEILYIGDGDTDMQFAKAMGFLAAGVTWGFRSREQLLAAGAEFLSDSFAELQEKIGLRES